MARTVTSLPAGSHTTESISLGVIAQFVPREKVREVFAQAALKAEEDPGRLSLVHAVRVVQRRLARWKLPQAIVRIVANRNQDNFREVKRSMSNYNLRPRNRQPTRRMDVSKRIRIIK